MVTMDKGDSSGTSPTIGRHESLGLDGRSDDLGRDDCRHRFRADSAEDSQAM